MVCGKKSNDHQFPIKNIDLYDCLANDSKSKHPYTTYDLIANIVHDGQPEAGKGTYRIQLMHRATGKWFELEDLHVTEILPQMITLTETYIQIYELNTQRKRTSQPTETAESGQTASADGMQTDT